MGKGSWRRPNGPDFDKNYCKNFPTSRGCLSAREIQARQVSEIADAVNANDKAERQRRADHAMQRSEERAKRLIALTLDELRSIVFETSVAYCEKHISQPVLADFLQEAEWNRAAALKTALERLGYARESEMIGGAA